METWLDFAMDWFVRTEATNLGAFSVLFKHYLDYPKPHLMFRKEGRYFMCIDNFQGPRYEKARERERNIELSN